MAIDIRAKVLCSLGEVITGSIADSYIQGNGLILVSGNVEINDIVTPAVGSAVTISYKINGGTRTIPRKLRVLSSFADPLRQTTSVQLGCKLTYLSDLREKLQWGAFDDPKNLIDYDPSDYEVIPVPVNASSMMDTCLEKLGITASNNPLTNQFSSGQYDFSSGWVAVLGELLISECFCGYLDYEEVLQVFSLRQNGGSGIVLTKGDLIDVGAINAGQLPGEAVTVTYNALKLKADSSASQTQTWQRNSTSNRSSVTISYSDPESQVRQTLTYNTLETVEETTDFATIVKDSTKEKISVVSHRKIVRTESSPKVLSNVMVQFLEAGLAPPTAQLTTTTEEWFYYDIDGVEIRSIKEVYADKAYAYGEAGLPAVFDVVVGASVIKTAVSIPFGSTYLKEATETDTLVQGSLRKVFTRKYGNWMATIYGQQAIAESRESFTSSGQVENYITQLVNGKYLINTDIYTEESTASGQRVPFSSNSTVQRFTKDDSNKQNETKLVLALGSATAQRRIEFNLPMAPDDVIVKDGGGYKIIPNNAYNKAKAFGIAQNRLLLGNRNGMNIQMSPLQMPDAPFAPLMVSVDGVTAMYRTNASSWTFNAEGIVASTDALFWGGVGSS